MVMNNIEYDAVVESAKIKAKSDITVAVLNNAASKEKLIEFIKNCMIRLMNNMNRP